MAIDSTKLLNRPSGSNTVSSKSVNNIGTIATTVSSIATIMKGNLVLDRMRDKKRRQKAQQVKRDAKERAREEGLGGKIKKKAQDVAGNVSDWLMRLVKGVFLIGLVKLLPTIQEWIPAFTEFIDNFIKSVKWLFKTVVNMIEGAYKIYDGVREWIGKKFGEGALEKFDGLMKHLNNFLNAALSAVVALLSFGWLRKLIKNVLKGGKTLLKAAIDIARRGAANIVKRTIKVGGKNALKTAVKAGNLAKNIASKGTSVVKKGAQIVGKKIGGLAARIFGKSAGAIVPGLKGALGPLSKFFSRVPIIGPLIVGIFSVLSGEPGGKALFRMVGAALGEFLGGALSGALAVGTAGIGALVAPALVLLGGTIGTWLGGVLYDLIQGGGIGAMKKKLGELVKGIFEKILDIGDWMRGGFMKFIKTFLKETAMPINKGWGVRDILTKGVKKLGIFDWLKEIEYVEGDQIAKFPNLLQLYNPFKLFPILKKSFFPVKDAVAEGKKLSAEKKAKEEGKKKKDDDKGTQSIEDLLAEDSNAKTEPVEEGGATDEKIPLTLGEMKSDSANGLDQHTSYDSQSTEGQTAFIPLVKPVGDGSGGTTSTINESSDEGSTTDEKLESAYAGS